MITVKKFRWRADRLQSIMGSSGKAASAPAGITDIPRRRIAAIRTLNE